MKNKSLGGLKLLAIILMILYHCGLIKTFDYGTYGCMFFFLVSGYTSGLKETKYNTLQYIKKKFRGSAFYYYISFFISVPLILSKITNTNLLKEAIVDGFFHLTLTQAWFPNITFKYNSVAWFLSAMMVCYLFTPILRDILCDKNKNSLLYLIILIFVLRIFIEYVVVNYPDSFEMSMHSNPIVRLLEYAIGMGVSIYLRKMHLLQSINKIMGTVLEIVIMSLTIIIFMYSDLLFIRKWFGMIPIIILIVIYSCESGIISRILSNETVQIICKRQTGLFLFHTSIIAYLNYAYKIIHFDIKSTCPILYGIIAIVVTYIFTIMVEKALLIGKKLWNQKL